jgi:hypothetical protein
MDEESQRLYEPPPPAPTEDESEDIAPAPVDEEEVADGERSYKGGYSPTYDDIDDWD